MRQEAGYLCRRQTFVHAVADAAKNGNAVAVIRADVQYVSIHMTSIR